MMINVNQINRNEVVNSLLGYRGNFMFLLKLRKSYKQTRRMSENQLLAAAKCLKVPSYVNAAGANRPVSTDPRVAKIEDAILNYNGNFEFIVSLKGQIKNGRTLSEKQLAGAQKVLFRPKVDAVKGKAEVIEGLNTAIVVKRWIARQLQKENKFDFAPFTFLVTKFHGQTAKAIRVSATLNGGDVAVCRCCGKALDTEMSKATGLGPVCAKRLGVKYITKKGEINEFRVQLAEKVKEIGEMTFWLPKSQLKEGESQLRNDIKISRAKKLASA